MVVESLPTGELLVMPAEKLRAHIRELGRRAIAENREALDKLAAYDRGEADVRTGKLSIPPSGRSAL